MMVSHSGAQSRLWGLIFPMLMIVLSMLACDVDTRMGELRDRQVFSALEGFQHEWTAQLDPNVIYEVKVQPLIAQEAGGHLGLEAFGAFACADCNLIADGNIPMDGLIITFQSPPNGVVRIVVYVGEQGDSTNPVMYSIEISELNLH